MGRQLGVPASDLTKLQARIPSRSAYLPSAQGEQTPLVWSEYVPALQFTHWLLLSATWPGGHAMHSVCSTFARSRPDNRQRREHRRVGRSSFVRRRQSLQVSPGSSAAQPARHGCNQTKIEQRKAQQRRLVPNTALSTARRTSQHRMARNPSAANSERDLTGPMFSNEAARPHAWQVPSAHGEQSVLPVPTATVPFWHRVHVSGPRPARPAGHGSQPVRCSLATSPATTTSAQL